MKTKWLGKIWPALLWSILIFILLIIPGKEMPAGPEIPSFDKIIHMFLFGIQVWLWCIYFKHGEKFSNRLGIFFLIFLLSCLYGIGMEYVQKYFVANRAFELGDIMADIAGSAIGLLLALKFK
ncbi:MAG: VanZ family protein [Chitinophagaceae bacterium]|nr:VanZ family protein [Chitinophagaceae bacterium]